MNENKVPCGGFRIGDGLTMEGDTLKSLGGTYVKVKVNINDNDRPTLEFMDDSPLKSFEEIRQKGETSLVTLLIYAPGAGVATFYLDIFSDSVLVFVSLNILDNELNEQTISIDSDNNITSFISRYTLTPAT